MGDAWCIRKDNIHLSEGRMGKGTVPYRVIGKVNINVLTASLSKSTKSPFQQCVQG